MKLAVRPLARCVRTCLLGRRQRLRSGPRYPVRDPGGRRRRLARELRISAADAATRVELNTLALAGNDGARKRFNLDRLREGENVSHD
jgi:hypothetical protein